MSPHIGQFLHQPVLTIVVVEHQHSVIGQPSSCCRQRILGEQEAFQAQAGVARGEGERVGQGKDNQVILVGGILQEVAPIIDDHVHARVLVGMIGVKLDTKLLDGGINLHRGDRIHAVGLGNRHVRPCTRTQDQRVVEGLAEGLIDELVKRLLVMPVGHRLMPASIVDIHDIAVRNGGFEQDFIVR